MNILLDYAFPVTVIVPVPPVSTANLRQAALVVKPKDGVSPAVTLCTTIGQVAAITDNTEAQQFFNAGMSRIYVVANASLDLDTLLDAVQGTFYTLMISSDFTDANVLAADFGTFDGVVAVWSSDKAYLATQAAIENRVGFFGNSTNKAKNMVFAFGKFLSNLTGWSDQQFVTLPFNDSIDTLGEAEELFDDRISFAISDSNGNRLGFFAVGGRAIRAPYVIKNLTVDLQSRAVTWISANQPSYTVKEAALLTTRLTEDVIKPYIAQKQIEAGEIEITLEQENFVATGRIDVAEPKALWRIFSELRQTL